MIWLILIPQLVNIFLFKNLKTNTPSLEMEYFISQPIPMAYMNVTLPENLNHQGKLFFTNYDRVNNYSGIINSSGSLSIRLDAFERIDGSVIVLLIERDSNVINSYTHFGIKNISVSPNEHINVNFTHEDLNSNIETGFISGNVVSSKQPGFDYTDFRLIFSTKNTVHYASNHLYFEHREGMQFSYLVPTNLPIPIYPVISAGHGPFQPGGGIFTNVIENFPGQITLTEPTNPQLISPQNGAEVNLNTVFEFTPGSDDGIFFVQFIGDKTFTILTDANSVIFGDLVKIGFDIEQFQSMEWYVEKIGRYTNINEFVNGRNVSYFSSKSEQRVFKYSP